jgi:AraC-like DNA-binding protein/mannose-6-phosphate isomerase-like protein (cupin superfamily)
MNINAPSSSKLQVNSGQDEVLRLSTSDIPSRERQGWLRDLICREYANVEVTSPTNCILSQDLLIYPWDKLRLSTILSSGISLKRLPKEPHLASQDTYFAVILVSGDYLLEQDGREVFLKPGDIAIYDATRPHRIHCPRDFKKLIVSIPRPVLRERIAGVEQCTALRISGMEGIGAIASSYLQSLAKQAHQLLPDDQSQLSEHALNLVTLAINSVRPVNYNLSRSRSVSLNHVKTYIEQHLQNLNLDTTMISSAVGLSSRYINILFEDKDTSLMRYVWHRRLENCRKDMLTPTHSGHRISDIAFRWGFNDLSHFSRAFRKQFDCSPREYLQQNK